MCAAFVCVCVVLSTNCKLGDAAIHKACASRSKESINIVTYLITRAGVDKNVRGEVRF